MDEVRWEYLRPRDMERRYNACPTVYVPFGSLEWHGYHNPLGVDTIKAHALCLRAARLGGGVVAPGTFWPIGGLPHPWTVRMTEEQVHALAAAIYEQMAHVGFRVVIAVTGHYGIEQVLHIKQAALEVMYRTGLAIYALPEFEVAVDLGYRGDHAAKWETSLIQALFPQLVDMSEAEPQGQPLDGVGGEDPRLHASAELGERAAELIAQRLSAASTRLLGYTQRQRSQFIVACAAQVRVLAAQAWGALRHPQYWEGVQALAVGEDAAAAAAFDSVPNP